MKKFDFFRQFRDAVLIVNKKGDVVYRNHTFKRWFKDFTNIKKLSHHSSFNICPLNSENIEIYSPIYHAVISKEDFFARISYQSELNRIYYYDLDDTLILFIAASDRKEQKKMQEKTYRFCADTFFFLHFQYYAVYFTELISSSSSS